jgi:gliding motility-associated lipoprotein GldD
MKNEKFRSISSGFIRCFSFFVILVMLSACSEYTPKPVGYNRIDLVDSPEIEYRNSHFSFHYPASARIDTIVNSDTAFWFNIVYPNERARIYCSYFPITRRTLNKSLEDSRRLAYGHVLMADGIMQTFYDNPVNQVSGSIYDIAGNVASPVQFFLTDSVSKFFRASLYYDVQTNADSVAPVTAFIRNDMTALMESFKWENSTPKQQ